MPSASAHLDTRYKSKDGTYPVVIRLIDGKKIKLHKVGYKITEKHWGDGQVLSSHPDYDIINSIIDDEGLTINLL